jgi:hypothetical protein
MVLRARGRRVVCTDITTDGVDFRDRTKAPAGAQATAANPPFSLAADFVRHGLKLVPKVVILERIQFLESEDRTDVIEGGGLARVLVFADRVPPMHKAGWSGKRSSPAMCLAWFVFERGYPLQPILKRIRCRPSLMRALSSIPMTSSKCAAVHRGAIRAVCSRPFRFAPFGSGLRNKQTRWN